MAESVFNEDERRALDLTGQLVEALGLVVGYDERVRAHDLNELLVHVHVIQRAIQANALSRIAPAEVRGLGRLIG